jgi:hypothetical protein
MAIALVSALLPHPAAGSARRALVNELTDEPRAARRR